MFTLVAVTALLIFMVPQNSIVALSDQLYLCVNRMITVTVVGLVDSRVLLVDDVVGKSLVSVAVYVCKYIHNMCVCVCVCVLAYFT